jgi:lipoate-protein ligase A
VGGKKLVGSAQRRYGRTFVQHGSILLGVDAPRLAAIFPTTVEPLATLTTLEAALGHRPKFDEVATALAAAFETEHGIRLRPDGLSASETARTERLVGEKYGTDAWLEGR